MSTPGSSRADDRCPRCGGTFRCGIADAGPCACTRVTLDAATLADLRARYDGCLCMTCLAELATKKPARPEDRAGSAPE